MGYHGLSWSVINYSTPYIFTNIVVISDFDGLQWVKVGCLILCGQDPDDQWRLGWETAIKAKSVTGYSTCNKKLTQVQYLLYSTLLYSKGKTILSHPQVQLGDATFSDLVRFLVFGF